MITKTFKRFENKYQLNESQLKQLMPMLLTRMKPDAYTAKTYIGYQRIAFVGKDDPELRVTFDYNLKSRQHSLSLEKGDFGHFLIPADHYLMEVKILGAIPLWLTHALTELEIYSSSFSKYGKAYKDYRQQSIGKLINLPIYTNNTIDNKLTPCVNN